MVPIDDEDKYWNTRTYPLSWEPYGQIVRFNYKWKNLWKGEPSLDDVRRDLLGRATENAEDGAEFFSNFQASWAIYAQENKGFAKDWPGSFRNWFLIVLVYPIFLALPVLSICGLLFLPGKEKLSISYVVEKSLSICGSVMKVLSTVSRTKNGSRVANPVSIVIMAMMIGGSLGYLGTIVAILIEEMLREQSYSGFDPKWHGFSEYILIGFYVGIPYTIWWFKFGKQNNINSESK